MAEISDGNTFGIFGHAVFLNAVAYAIANAANSRDAEDILDLDLGEAEALVLDLEIGAVDHLHPGRK